MVPRDQARRRTRLQSVPTATTDSDHLIRRVRLRTKTIALVNIVLCFASDIRFRQQGVEQDPVDYLAVVGNLELGFWRGIGTARLRLLRRSQGRPETARPKTQKAEANTVLLR